MQKDIINILISGFAVLLLDSVFLTFNKKMFEKQVFDIQKSKLELNLLGVIPCYIFIIGALNYFIISKKSSLFDAFLLGAIINGVFETTTISVFKEWQISTVFIDTIWGGVLFALATYFTYTAQKYL